MRCLVTGATGFIGSFLAQRLCESGCAVSALARDVARAGGLLPHAVRLLEGRVEDRDDCERAVAASEPDRVFHLAAQSYPVASWQDPQGTFSANALGTIHVLDAIRASGRDPSVVVACSSAEYAAPADGAPLPESGRLLPSSPYGVSKLAADFAAQLYADRYGMRIVRVRPFFLIGPRKTGDVCSDFARGLAAAERTGHPTLRVGNLEIVRDFLDIADGVRAFVLAAERGERGAVYNICSGRGYRLREVLDRLKAMAKVAVREEIDPSLLRPVDEPVKVGDPSRLMALGWRPERSIDDSLRDILAYWRETAS